MLTEIKVPEYKHKIQWGSGPFRQDKRARGSGDADRGARLRRRQAGRTRGHARGGHLLYTGATAGLHSPYHCGGTERRG